MSIKFLEPVLGDELYQQVVEKLDGNEEINIANLSDGGYVRKDKYDGETGRLTEEVEDLSKQITTLQASLKNVETSTDDIEKIKADAATALQASQDQLVALETKTATETLSYETSLAIIKAGAKDDKSVMAHLDMKKISITEGAVIGLDEQITALKESHEYLFGEPKPTFKAKPANPPQTPPEEADVFKAKHAEAMKSGNLQGAIKIKQEAAEAGVILT